jgi:asparagine synthetase B (glutamine-hydrolysing)
MLSGGVDSFLMLAAVARLYDASDIEALIIYGVESDDTRKAIQAAKYFNVKIIEREVMMGEVFDNLNLLKGTNDTSVFQAMFRICGELALRDLSVKGKAVYQGDGADSLYGNSSHFIYLPATELAKEKQISKDEAREMLRTENRKKVMRGKGSGTARLMGEIIKEHGGVAVQPFSSGELEYLLEVPLRKFQGDKKTWVKQAMINLWGLPSEIVMSRQRCSMQDGMGYYKLFNEELKKTYKSKSANAVIKQLCRA